MSSVFVAFTMTCTWMFGCFEGKYITKDLATCQQVLKRFSHKEYGMCREAQTQEDVERMCEPVDKGKDHQILLPGGMFPKRRGADYCEYYPR